MCIACSTPRTVSIRMWVVPPHSYRVNINVTDFSHADRTVRASFFLKSVVEFAYVVLELRMKVGSEHSLEPSYLTSLEPSIVTWLCYGWLVSLFMTLLAHWKDIVVFPSESYKVNPPLSGYHFGPPWSNQLWYDLPCSFPSSGLHCLSPQNQMGVKYAFPEAEQKQSRYWPGHFAPA